MEIRPMSLCVYTHNPVHTLPLSDEIQVLIFDYVAKLSFKGLRFHQARWLTPVIPALWEAEVDGSRGQDIKTILVNMVKPRLY